MQKSPLGINRLILEDGCAKPYHVRGFSFFCMWDPLRENVNILILKQCICLVAVLQITTYVPTKKYKKKVSSYLEYVKPWNFQYIMLKINEEDLVIKYIKTDLCKSQCWYE